MPIFKSSVCMCVCRSRGRERKLRTFAWVKLLNNSIVRVSNGWWLMGGRVRSYCSSINCLTIICRLHGRSVQSFISRCHIAWWRTENKNLIYFEHRNKPQQILNRKKHAINRRLSVKTAIYFVRFSKRYRCCQYESAFSLYILRFYSEF